MVGDALGEAVNLEAGGLDPEDVGMRSRIV
jgi:hypothetical protein